MVVEYIPLGSRCIIQRDPVKRETSSGLIIPEQAQERSREATVFAVGAEVTHVKAGDRVLVSPGKGTTPLDAMPDHYFVMESDIYCILK